ncbi:hypothetical protein BDF21DRAFT_499044 [Thamnidium elegans]|uniref:ArfGap-domain-containing protein n=1 Tax=Thamnidium elegans TaxID=101142 RepID=A0A8H7VXQ1_9FUNG|nr:hypothetical protein INT48_005413 [Thamnidium elegans]KAI8047120.1 hypothetical protein BDF21DRAFT_499044 [Thamnidium elegans]
MSNDEGSLDVESRTLLQEEDMTPHLPPRNSVLCNQPSSLTPSVSKATFDDPYLEDGPLFRATIHQLENRTSTLKTNLKRIIKTATTCLEARRQLTRADESYLDALRDTQCIEPLMSHYLNNAWQIIKEERKRLDQSLSTQLLETLKRVYEEDIKVADVKRRQFEEESKDYYASLAKYLKATNKKKQETEKKQNQRKSRFDLARFDYLAFLIDLHGGRKEGEILFHVTDHTMKGFDFYESIAHQIEPERPRLNDLVAFMTENSREQELAANERANKRKELLTTCQLDAIADTVQDDASVQIDHPVITVQDQTLHVEGDRFKGIRDLDQNRGDTLTGRKKEGFLFATAKPSKSTGFDVTSSSITWHKYWCVLSGGKLHEYSNWKRQLESHIEPINLRFATVREARNSERRFCFEVITPHMRRIYQATSQEEAQSWMGTIQNSIESLLNGTSNSSANLKDIMTSSSSSPQSNKRHGRSLSGAFKSGLAVVAAATHPNPNTSSSKDKKRQSTNMIQQSIPITNNSPAEGAELLVSASASPNDRFRWSGFSFGNYQHSKVLSSIQQQTSNNNNGNYLFSALADSEGNTRLLSILRQDTSNHYCADCGAKNPDWCSLNLGVLLCIECSGIHRSLGTHISKIRSLTLDSTSYTPDIIELLKSIGNARSNSVWDNRYELSNTADTTTIARPNPTDSRAMKLSYIQAKYVGRNFVKKPTENADKILFEAIDHDDIPKALYALAAGANVNSSRPDFSSSPRISLFMGPSSDTPPIQSFMPFLMNMDLSEKVELETEKNYIVRYALHYSLLHGRVIDNEDVFVTSPLVASVSSSSTATTATRSEEDYSIKKSCVIFPMAEFLLQNGADTGIIDTQTGHTLAELVGMGSVVDDHAITYISVKNTARGQSAIVRSVSSAGKQPTPPPEEVTEENIPPPLPQKDSIEEASFPS